MATTPAAQGMDTLPPAARRHVERLRDGLQAAVGADLAALVVYGSAVRGSYDEETSDIDVIVVLRDTALPKLVACANPLLLARHSGRVEAMVLREDEIAAASDVFPLFYDDIRSRHVLAAGVDPFQRLTISDAHRRLRIEQELREARIRMRRAAVDAMGVDAALVGALARKVKQIRGPLHALLRLKGVSCDDTVSTVLHETGKAYGVDTAPLLRVHEDPAAAHAAFRKLIDTAVDDVDRMPAGGAS